MNITVLQFHSRAKKLPKYHALPEDATYRLSNFSPDSVEYEGRVYPSAEHAYQAQKYANANELMAQFYDGTIVDPVEAKRKGSKSGMKSTKVVLDVARWARDQDQIMEAIITSKIERSDHIRNIVRLCAQHGVRLVHFSRRDMYWGAHFDQDAFEVTDGLNKLGEIYNRKICVNAISSK